MARLDSWVSPDVMHAMGWALIHSLWQCLGLAALAAVLMTFSRRPSVRYLVAVSTLALMLAAPVATFFVLMKPGAPVQALFPTDPGSLLPARSGPSLSAAPKIAIAYPVPATSDVISNRSIGALMDFPRPLPNILPWLVGAWLCGVVFFSLRFAGAFLLLERKSRQSAALSPHILALCHELQHQLGLTRAIRYLECSWLQVPAVIGWFRPIVFLPAFALTGLSEVQLRAVIAHELAHIRRFDFLVNLFQILVETLLFYHPAMWWLNRRIRAERELVCDEIAVSLAGNRFAYARALTLIAQRATAPALAMALGRGSLSQRVFHIMGQRSVGAGQRMLGLTGSILFLAAALGAANALFGIAYPIPAAHAKATLRAALSSIVTEAHATPQQPMTAAASNPLPAEISRNLQPVKVAAPDLVDAAVQPDNAPPPLLLAVSDTADPALSVAQPAAQPASGAPESITVTATPLPGRDAVDEFIYSYPTAVRTTDKIARWKVGICPMVMGLPQKYADFIGRRLIAIARKAGAPVNSDPKCRHNIEIVFTAKPQALADDVHKNHRPYLGYFDNLHQADDLAKVTHDIQAWYLTGTMGFDGSVRVDNPRQDFLTAGGDGFGEGRVFYAAGTGRFNNGISSTLYNVIIVADPTKLGDYEMGALADYISMLALSQPKSFDDCWEVPSITNLLAKACAPDRKTATLSDNDAAFLYGLYKMSTGQNIYVQRDEIRYFLERNPPKD